MVSRDPLLHQSKPEAGGTHRMIAPSVLILTFPNKLVLLRETSLELALRAHERTN